MSPIAVARSSSGALTIGCIAYRGEGGDRRAQRGRSVIYDCLVVYLQNAWDSTGYQHGPSTEPNLSPQY